MTLRVNIETGVEYANAQSGGSGNAVGHSFPENPPRVVAVQLQRKETKHGANL